MPIEALEELKTYDQWVGYSRSKLPISANGTLASSTDRKTWGTFEEAKFIRKVKSLQGVGFVFSPTDPFVGVDLDKAIDPVTDELKPWARDIVDRLDSYTELSPSRLGVHIWLRGDIPRNGAKRSYDDDPVKVECYKQARYFTVTGYHLPSTPTTINSCDELGEWFEEIFGREDASTTSAMPTNLDLGVWEAPNVESWLGEALTYIDADDYHEWVKVGMAIKAELGDRGWPYFDVWSASSQKYAGERRTRKKWESFGYEGAVGIASIVWLAERHGFVVPKGVAKLPAAMDEDWDQWLADQQKEAMGEEDGGDRGLELSIMDASDLYVDRTPFEPDLIGPGVLGKGDMALLFGPPKSMKSMVIMDAFRNFALGRSWCGLVPQRPLRTFYCQFEVKADKMRQRLQLAQMSDEDVEAMRGMFMITERFTPVLNAEFVQQFGELARATFTEGIDVLILDPLANIYTGDSENDNAQMARFIRQIKLLRNAINPDVAIVMVHHSSKMQREDRHADPFNSGRGASSLRGAYDTGIYLDRLDEGSELVKMWMELRNGPPRAPFSLAFRDGRFVEQTTAEQQEFDIGEMTAADPIRIEFERLLREEAMEGRYYTNNTFAETFSGAGSLGSASTIRRHISRLATLGSIGWFVSVGDEELPSLPRNSNGYLCCRQMVLLVNSRVREVRPQLMKSPRSGQIMEVDSWPRDW